MWESINSAMKWVYGLNPQDTVLLLFAALVLGFLCLRGFGSRSSY